VEAKMQLHSGYGCKANGNE
jgi:hypothetical protein